MTNHETGWRSQRTDGSGLYNAQYHFEIGFLDTWPRHVSGVCVTGPRVAIQIGKDDMANSDERMQLVATSLIVSDLERSARFYCEGLDFKAGAQRSLVGPPGSHIAKVCGLPEGCKYNIRILVRPELKMAVAQYEEPAVLNEWIREPANRIGRGSLFLFNCRDAKATAERLIELGGQIEYIADPRESVGGPAQYSTVVTDPDGFRIQLVTVSPRALESRLKNNADTASG